MFIAEYQAPSHFEATPSQVIASQEVSNPNYFSNIKESYLQSKSNTVESKSQPKFQVKLENGKTFDLSSEVTNRLQKLKNNQEQAKSNKSTVNFNEGYQTTLSSEMGRKLDNMNGVKVAQFSNCLPWENCSQPAYPGEKMLGPIYPDDGSQFCRNVSNIMGIPISLTYSRGEDYTNDIICSGEVSIFGIEAYSINQSYPLTNVCKWKYGTKQAYWDGNNCMMNGWY
jgi:hypothetical protein